MSVPGGRAAPSRPAAPSEPQPRAVLELVLAVCIQQRSFHDMRLAGRLLCVSRWLASLVDAWCKQALTATWEERRGPTAAAAAHAFGCWLTKHGQLLDSLDLAVHATGQRMPGVAAAPPTACSILERLPANVTRLCIEWRFAQHPARQQLAQALATRLADAGNIKNMRLRELVLPRAMPAREAALLLPALAGLRELTRLSLSYPENDGSGELLAESAPASLRELQLFSDTRRRTAGAAWLALSRLSGLTSLRMAEQTSVDGDGPLLVTLHALKCYSVGVEGVQPLLALSQLTRLEVGACTLGDDMLRQLTRLRLSLQELHLTYLATPPGRLSAAAAAFASLPLTSLAAWPDALGAETLRHIGGATRLTSLELSFGFAHDAGFEQLAWAVARLGALRNLQLLHMRPPPKRSQAGAAALCGAAARLPALERLSLAGLRLPREAAAALADATRLTGLSLDSADLDDAVARAMCARLHGLRALQLTRNGGLGGGLTRAGLAGLAASLPHLTHLFPLGVMLGQHRSAGAGAAGVH